MFEMELIGRIAMKGNAVLLNQARECACVEGHGPA